MVNGKFPLGYSKRMEKFQLEGKETVVLEYTEYQKLAAKARLIDRIKEDIRFKDEFEMMVELLDPEDS